MTLWSVLVIQLRMPVRVLLFVDHLVVGLFVYDWAWQDVSH
jgi:hypothetical protein